MATEKLVYKCPACKSQITVKRPLLTGVYKMVCPHCRFPHQLKLPGQDSVGTPQAPATPAAPAAPQVPSFGGTVPPVPAGAIPPTPAGAVPPPFGGGIRVAGPGIAAAAEAQAPSKTEPVTLKRMGKARLTQLGSRFSFNKSFDLPVGDVVIGRTDSAQPSDISITGDEFISRRSVKITVKYDELKGYSYCLRVLKSTNPVMLNDQPLDPKYDEPYLNLGDIIKLGRTSLRLDPVK